jgi:hypothetical protein
MQTYSFGKTILLINGVQVTGYDEGDDVITMRRLNDNSAHVLSADGVMTVSFSPDRSGEIIFRVNQASDINGLLSSLVTTQEQNVLVPLTVQFTDLNGNDIMSATAGYIPRPADVTRGLNSQSQEWRIVVEKLVMLHRGGLPIV